MRLRNGPDRFGAVSRALHWLMAAGVLAMLGLGTALTRMEVSLSNLWLYGLHKSLGLVLLALLLVRLGWHAASPPPPPLASGAAWKNRLARLAHRAFYGLLLAVPLTGWVGSAATGIDVQLFGLTLPRIAPVSVPWETAAFAAHGILTKALAVLAALHVGAALLRRDGTMRRMLTGAATPP
jgi:cytochrome b561